MKGGGGVDKKSPKLKFVHLLRWLYVRSFKYPSSMIKKKYPGESP